MASLIRLLLQPHSPRDFVISQLGKEHYKDFLIFAFGKDFNESSSLEKIPDLWNSLHPNNLISKNNDIMNDLQMMISLFKENARPR